MLLSSSPALDFLVHAFSLCPISYFTDKDFPRRKCLPPIDKTHYATCYFLVFQLFLECQTRFPFPHHFPTSAFMFDYEQPAQALKTHYGLIGLPSDRIRATYFWLRSFFQTCQISRRKAILKPPS